MPRVMLSDEYPAMNFLGPQSRGGTSVHLHVYVKDCDATIIRARLAPRDPQGGAVGGGVEEARAEGHAATGMKKGPER